MTDVSHVVVYSHGLVCCSACAPKEMSARQVADEVNVLNPTGISSPWEVSSDRTFFGSEKTNPGPCEVDASRKHWLLTC